MSILRPLLITQIILAPSCIFQMKVFDSVYILGFFNEDMIGFVDIVKFSNLTLDITDYVSIWNGVCILLVKNNIDKAITILANKVSESMKKWCIFFFFLPSSCCYISSHWHVSLL